MTVRVGKYELLDLLGKGGMGEVWRAVDPALGRTVALKLMQRSTDEDLVRFRREAHAVAQLTHPNVAQLYEVGDEPPYLAMQLIDGTTIDRVDGVDARARALAQAARGVHAAHEKGILHRDLKPANILVDGEGRAFVLDFGLAREVRGGSTSVSMTGDVLGTPSYMAPEQARGDLRALDARTDVYGLGATLYALLAGRPPHHGPNAFDVVVRVIEEPPSSPGGPRDLEIICLKAMEKEPARRYATAAALADDVERYLCGEAIVARPASFAYRLRKRIQRQPRLWAVSSLLVAALVGGAAFAVQQFVARQELRARQRDELARREELERASRELREIDDELSYHQGDEALAALRGRLEDLVRRMGERAGPAEPAFWYLRAEAETLLYRDEEAVADYTKAIDGVESEWMRAMGVVAKAALGRAQARLALMRDAAMGTRGFVDSRRPRPDALVPLILADLQRAQAGARTERIRSLATLEAALVKEDRSVLDTVFIAESDKAIGGGGRNEAVYTIRGLHSAGEGRVHCFSASIDRHRGQARVFFYRGEAYLQLGKFDLALADFTEAIRLRPRFAESFNNRGVVHTFEGRFDLAIADFDRATAIRPDYSEAYVNRGAARLNLGEVEAAIEEFGRAIEAGPDNGDAYFNRGSVRSMRGDFRGAVLDLTEAIRLNPGDAGAHLKRGNAWRELGELQCAVDDFTEALAKRPDYPEALANRGLLLRDLGRPAEARADLRRALEIAPADWSYRARAEEWLRETESGEF